MANQLGKRYACPKCDTLVLCVRRSEGSVECCGGEMALQEPRQLPSSD